jgi:hypothetical protein
MADDCCKSSGLFKGFGSKSFIVTTDKVFHFLALYADNVVVVMLLISQLVVRAATLKIDLGDNTRVLEGMKDAIGCHLMDAFVSYTRNNLLDAYGVFCMLQK